MAQNGQTMIQSKRDQLRRSGFLKGSGLLKAVAVYDVVRWALLVLILLQLVRLIWMAVTPVSPFGQWQAPQVSILPIAQRARLLGSFDPFDLSAQGSGAAAVTSLDLTLYGLRMNEASGQGSAILAGSDGVQRSYVIGQEIAPGVTLAAVNFDSVELDRGGARESLFIDQSVPAETISGANPAASVASTTMPSPNTPSTPAPSALNAENIANAVSFAPRNENGRVTGFAVNSTGDPALFAAAGFRPGDIISQINGRDVSSQRDIDQFRDQIKPGARLSVMVERGANIVPIAIVIPSL